MPADQPLIAGRYELERPLGHGGMSEVWRATDRELGRRVAIKLLAPDADTARFDREARAIASLAHPNIVQLYDYGHDEGRPYMVLEYVPGGTLEERLAEAKGKPLPDAETTAIAGGVAAGLAHAHARGVVHRDLKPANVLFDEEGRAKLADFGIARLAAGEGTLTEAGTVLGTAAYISPEQASGSPASPASDVYSFGVMLYRMLTGRLPFESSDPMELVRMNRDDPPPPIASVRTDVPGRLESTATAALEKDPRDRPHDGAALLAALGIAAGTVMTTATTALAADATQVLPTAAAGAAAPTTAMPVAAGGPPEPPPAPRSRVPLVVAILIVLLLAGGALAYAVTRSSSSGADTGTTTLPSLSLPSTKKTTTQATTAPATTTAPTTSTTAPTTTQHTTTQQTTTHPATTTAPPPPTTLTVPATDTTPTTTDLGTTTTITGFSATTTTTP
jgi:serine/threonine-protein kinase